MAAKLLKKYPLLRVVNSWDPVAMLPWILSRTHFEFPPTIFYHHVGEKLTLYKSPKPISSLPGNLMKLAFSYKRLIANHFIDLYLQRLGTLQKKPGQRAILPIYLRILVSRPCYSMLFPG